MFSCLGRCLHHNGCYYFDGSSFHEFSGFVVFGYNTIDFDSRGVYVFDDGYSSDISGYIYIYIYAQRELRLELRLRLKLGIE